MTTAFFMVTIRADLGVTGNRHERTMVISEPIDVFWDRHASYKNVNDTVIVWSMPIQKQTYMRLKRHNPTNESYWKMNRKDYSRFISEED